MQVFFYDIMHMHWNRIWLNRIWNKNYANQMKFLKWIAMNRKTIEMSTITLKCIQTQIFIVFKNIISIIIETEISDIYNIFFEICWFNFPLEYSFFEKNNKTKLLLLWFPCDSKPISSSYRCSINCRVCCWYQYICVLKKNRRMLYCESLPIYHACMNLISIGCNMIKSFNTYFKLQIPINDDKKTKRGINQSISNNSYLMLLLFLRKDFPQKVENTDGIFILIKVCLFNIWLISISTELLF